MATKPNPAAWLCATNDLQVLQFDDGVRELKQGEVRINMKRVGICGSDVHYLKHGRCADFILNDPMVIGHESAGTVSEVGPGISHLQVGDNVAIEPGIPCRHCTTCAVGRYNLCDEMQFHATPPYHGSLTNHLVHPASLCFRLPSGMTLDEGAMCEPLSVAVHAANRAQAKPGQKVVVMGSGPIGICSLLVLKAYGVSRIVMTDVSDSRLAFATQMGASAGVNVAGLSEEETSAAIIKAVGQEADVVVDCVGLQSSVRVGIKAMRSGGRFCLVGMGHNEMSIPLTAAASREVDVVGVFRYCNTYPTCIDLISSGRVDVKPLITRRFDLTSGLDANQIKEGFEVAASGQAIKVMFEL